MDYFYAFSDQNTSANSSCPSSAAKWCTDDDVDYQLCIQNPSLLPTCLLALIIGLTCSKRIGRLPGKFPSRWFYQVAFFLFGIMMTSAGILHCFIGDEQKLSDIIKSTDNDSFQLIQLLVTVIDVGLTSNIAITILFCGLCDIKFFNPQSIGTRYLLVVIYFFVFLLWTLGLLNEWNWVIKVLYFGVIAISCVIYLLTQLCIKTARRALLFLFVAGLYGAFGLYATSIGAEHICASEGPFWSQYIGPEFVWFLFSDISMAFVFAYVIRANQEKRIIMRNYPADIEKHSEKF